MIAQFLGDDFKTLVLLNKNIGNQYSTSTWISSILRPDFKKLREQLKSNLFKQALTSNPLETKTKVEEHEDPLSKAKNIATCAVCAEALKKADQIANYFEEADVYDEEKQNECEEVIEYTIRVVNHYQKFLEPISLSSLKKAVDAKRGRSK